MDDWFADEELWRIFGDCMFGEERFTAAKDEAASLLAIASINAGTVLDLGCGPGRHAIPLSELGCQVTGLDLSAHLLKLAQQRAKATPIEWVQQDMRQFERPNSFDLIISMWTSFGYFDDPADDLAVLRQCRSNLRDGGTLIVDIASKEIICRDIEPVHLTEYDNGALLIERPLVTHQMTRYENQWLLLKDGRYWTRHWHQNLYSGQELSDLMLSADFSSVELYGSLHGDDYDLNAERLVAVARA